MFDYKGTIYPDQPRSIFARRTSWQRILAYLLLTIIALGIVGGLISIGALIHNVTDKTQPINRSQIERPVLRVCA